MGVGWGGQPGRGLAGRSRAYQSGAPSRGNPLFSTSFFFFFV